MAQSMVHYHFKSNEQIWKAAIEQLMRDLSERFPLAKDELKDLDPVSRLKVLVRRFLKMSARDISLSRIMIHEGTAFWLNWIAEKFLKLGFEPLDETVEEGVDAGFKYIYTVTHTIISAAAMTYCLAPVAMPPMVWTWLNQPQWMKWRILSSQSYLMAFAKPDGVGADP